MAKTSKNKTKLWRKQARAFNVQAGRTHTGRSMKNHWTVLPAQASPLLQNLFLKNGIVTLPVINEALIEQEGVVTNEAQ